MIQYRIELHDLHAHLYRVTLSVPQPAGEQCVSLPVWIPGSYLVRDFARHLSQLQARQGRKPCALRQLDSSSWSITCAGRGALTLSYLVYAFDPSVRAAFVDRQRGFFNGTSLCLRVEGREAEAHRISLAGLPRGWSVATAMSSDGAKGWLAADYDELVDHPFELGPFWRAGFSAAGVAHEIVVAGAWPGLDGDRLLADARRLCETQIAFWHGKRRPQATVRGLQVPAPCRRRRSRWSRTPCQQRAAMCAPRPAAQRRSAAATRAISRLLGLMSHEYFHAWNVKRLKPRELERIDYTRANHSSLLWFFEGFTSYYDELLLLRAGLIDAAQYLNGLAKTINGVANTPGRKVQSVAQASFDAWVKYYRSDENTANATVSYYGKGALVALALDLTLRRECRATLDAVMRQLWRASRGAAIDEADIAKALCEVGGRSYQRELAAWVHGRSELPLTALLDAAGVRQGHGPPSLGAGLGLRLSEAALSGVQVKSVQAGSAAAAAGVSAGDELLAVDDWRIRRLDDAQQWLATGRPFELLLVREQRVMRLSVQPEAAPRPPLTLALADKPAADVAALRRGWLGV